MVEKLEINTQFELETLRKVGTFVGIGLDGMLQKT